MNNQWSARELERIRAEFASFQSGSNSRGLLKLEKDSNSGIAWLAISNVGKKNCFDGSMMAQFSDIMDQLQDWPEGKVLVIYGENGFFSSGGDLDTVRRIAHRSGGTKMIQLMQYNLERLQSLPLITVAYIEGMALGGGAELITACDYRLATERARLGFVQVRIGITTVWGGGARLVDLIGHGRALELIATGRMISTSEALNIGLIDRILPEKNDQTSPKEEAKTTMANNVNEFLSPFLSLPRQTMLVGKSVTMAARRHLQTALEQEMQHGLSVWGGPVHQKALAGKVNHKKDQNQSTDQ